LTTALLPSIARLGLYRVILAMLPSDLPAPYGEIESAQQSTPLAMSGQRDEFAVLPSTLSQAEALTSLGDKPLVVVSATVDTQQGWPAAQEAMVSLSSNSSHRLAPGQTHSSLIASETGAEVSLQAIRDVLTSVRTGAPVAQ
jgi:hypothetical protein